MKKQNKMGIDLQWVPVQNLFWRVCVRTPHPVQMAHPIRGNGLGLREVVVKRCIVCKASTYIFLPLCVPIKTNMMAKHFHRLIC